mmetsp:Transcript_32817/g.73510  ORF Transcript_32817/g.73510 Transcript_32817/m.73510 type:complete len:667 (+) Transcript_32817:26-2026(+)
MVSAACLVWLVVGGTHSQLLGGAPTATSKEIARAFRKLALRYHPDKTPSPAAHKKFVKLSEAYDMLSDPTKRRQYDAGRAGPPAPSPQHGSGRQGQHAGGSRAGGGRGGQQGREQYYSWERQWRAPAPPPPGPPAVDWFASSGVLKVKSSGDLQRLWDSAQGPTVLLVYASSPQASRSHYPAPGQQAPPSLREHLREAFVFMADHFEGFVSVVAFNCDYARTLCQARFKAIPSRYDQALPTIMFKKDKQAPVAELGHWPPRRDFIADWVMGQVDHRVKELAGGVQHLGTDSKPHLILFSTGSHPVAWKALSLRHPAVQFWFSTDPPAAVLQMKEEVTLPRVLHLQNGGEGVGTWFDDWGQAVAEAKVFAGISGTEWTKSRPGPCFNKTFDGVCYFFVVYGVPHLRSEVAVLRRVAEAVAAQAGARLHWLRPQRSAGALRAFGLPKSCSTAASCPRLVAMRPATGRYAAAPACKGWGAWLDRYAAGVEPDLCMQGAPKNVCDPDHGGLAANARHGGDTAMGGKGNGGGPTAGPTAGPGRGGDAGLGGKGSDGGLAADEAGVRGGDACRDAGSAGDAAEAATLSAQGDEDRLTVLWGQPWQTAQEHGPAERCNPARAALAQGCCYGNSPYPTRVERSQCPSRVLVDVHRRQARGCKWKKGEGCVHSEA